MGSHYTEADSALMNECTRYAYTQMHTHVHTHELIPSDLLVLLLSVARLHRYIIVIIISIPTVVVVQLVHIRDTTIIIIISRTRVDTNSITD